MLVKVDISGLDFTQDLGPLIKSFFPRDQVDIVFSDHITDTQEASGDSFSTGFNLKIVTDEDGFTIIQENSEGKRFSFEYTDVPDEKMTFEKRKRRAYRNLLLREVYRLLSEKTKRELPWGILTGVRPTKLCFERLKTNTVGNISYMMDEYLCSPRKAGMAQKIAARELEILSRFDYERGYSLYVGFPFCPSICNYCSFGSHPIERYKDLVQDYINALIKEIESTSYLLKDRKLQTIYFGGGTPTAVSCEQLKSVINQVRECFDTSDVLEFCVEAGRPDSIDLEKLHMMSSEGITRISINPQTMREKTLKLIGRKHSATQTVEAFKLARSLKFDNINMDIIAGLSGECFDDMKYTLDEIKKLSPESLTVHTLALKRAARLSTDKDRYKGLEATDVEKMVDYAADFCMENGYEPYYLYRQKNMTENLENVGYARPGKEGLYNILIMEEVQMILALGAGASSKFLNFDTNEGKRFGRVENVKNVVEYIGRIDEMIERKKCAFQRRNS